MRPACAKEMEHGVVCLITAFMLYSSLWCTNACQMPGRREMELLDSEHRNVGAEWLKGFAVVPGTRVGALV